MLKLKTEKRDIFGKKLKDLREKGKLPAILYGNKKDSVSLFVNAGEFKKLWKKAGESTLIELTEPMVNVIIHDVSLSPTSNDPVHVDFYAVDMDKTITATVPVIFDGVAPAVKELGGVLVKVMHEVEVESLPKDLPHELHADISKLNTLESRIEVKDIILPSGVNIKSKADEVVALVEPPRGEEEEAPAMTIDDIEVEKKGKEDSKEDDEAAGSGQKENN